MIEISTSVLNLSEEDYVHSFYNLEVAKTDYFHIDVMDGKFVKNDTSKRMKEYAMAISHISELGLDVHLMVENVEEYIDDYIELEPRIISFHIEAIKEKQRILDIIKDLKRNNIRVRDSYKSRNSYRFYKRIFTINSYGFSYERCSRRRWTGFYTRECR